MSSSNAPLDTFTEDLEFYATCGKGLESLLAREFKGLGFSGVQSAGAGVRFHGPLTEGYRACLWSRLANRVLLPIHKGMAQTPEMLYERVQEIDWSEHVGVDGSLAVDFFTANSAITHSQYGALKVKDAVVDQFREAHGRRPNVDRDTPDIRINVYLFRDQARIAIDLSGSSLHRRGYRGSGGLAPLKENLAAAILLACDWPAAVDDGRVLFDPLCGSGTLLIEAAMIACRQAPGLLRSYYGFNGWKHHDAAAWDSLLVDARAAKRMAPVTIAGADQDPAAIDACRQNILAAGLDQAVSVVCQSLSVAPPPGIAHHSSGYVVTNPPYGERLAADARFYADLGAELSRYYGGWNCTLFTAAAAPYARARLPLATLVKTRNGGIDCVLLCGQIPAVAGSRSAAGVVISQQAGESAVQNADVPEHPQSGLYRKKEGSLSTSTKIPSSQVDVSAFTNRLKKNQSALKGWLKQNGVTAFRLYDADLPEFAVAIDLYRSEQTHCVVQEYQAPATVNVAMAELRLQAVMEALPDVLGVPAEHVHLKIRQVKSGNEQYGKLVSAHSTIVKIEEGGMQFELNLSDYLDTGLFLDHRPVRRFIGQNCDGKRFLNLFAYTATATVAAVAGGAKSSVSVDSSNRYCQWAKRNLDVNGAAAQVHEVVRQDAFTWLAAAMHGLSDINRFDLVLLDPPTFSNSTDQAQDWNVQRDHVAAIDACLSVMAPGALLIFSNNYRRFKLDQQLLADTSRNIRVEDRSRWSIDRDFHRNQRIHQCWFIYKD